MEDKDQKNLITSKEILLKTGISRATLNNYIKMGIIPRPMVMRPKDEIGRIKKIGYFPYEVLGRIETVKRLKKQGLSMGEIRSRFRESSLLKFPKDERQEILIEQRVPDQIDMVKTPGENVLHLSLDSLSLPAYLLNYGFEVIWANPEAMQKVFMQNTNVPETIPLRNVFKWLFHWELHNVVQNWKDLLSLHMSYAKSRFQRTWLQTAYKGISAGEIEILEDLYDRAAIHPEKDIYESHINFLKRDGATESYHVFTMSFREGRLFVYASSEGFVPW